MWFRFNERERAEKRDGMSLPQSGVVGPLEFPDQTELVAFQTFRLEVRFDKPSHCAKCQLTIVADSVAALGDYDKTLSFTQMVPRCRKPLGRTDQEGR